MLLATVQEIVLYLMLAFAIWGFIDCAVRPSSAFPAVNRQTKIAWLTFIGLAGLFIYIGGMFLGVFSMVLVAYYFVDVRAKVLALTRNRY